MAILQKRSLTPGSIPTTSSLQAGELAMNVPDGRIFLRKSGSGSDTIQSAITTGAQNSGSVILTGSITLVGQGNVLDVVGDLMEFSGSLKVSGSVSINGPASITGSLIVTQGITGSLFGTASWAQNSITASYALNVSGTINNAISSSYSFTASSAVSSSFAENAISASLAFTASSAISSSFANFAISASSAFTASSAISSSFAGTASSAVSSSNALTASYQFPITVTGSTLRSVSPLGGVGGSKDGSIFFGTSAGSNATSANDSNFLGFSAGESATIAYNSNFFGTSAGYQATNANNSNFFGVKTGDSATSASYSILIGYKAGYNVAGGALGIKSNNIIIGTNITLPDGTKDSINLGAIIFATGSYSASAGNPFPGSVNGRVGINQLNPTFSLDVSGSGRYTNGLQVTGSLNAPTITGSLFGTSSWALNFITSSVTSASFASSSSLSVSSSYALTASYALNAGGASAITVADEGTAQGIATFLNFTGAGVTATVSSNTASINIPGGAGAAFPYTGSAQITGSLGVTGSINVTEGITGSLFGTASWATNFITSSVTSASYAFTASSAISSSFAGNTISSSYAFTASSAVSSSFANNTISASYAFTASSAVSSSYAFTASSAVSAFTASSSVSSSLAISASYAFTASSAVSAFTASSAVNATNALTASSADNFLVRSSLTASAALINGTITATTLVVQTITSSITYSSGSNRFGNLTIDQQTFTGSVNISGSLNVNGKATITDLTGSLFGTASWATNAISSSYPIAVTGSTLRSVSPAGGIGGNTSDSIFFGTNAGSNASIANYSNFLGRDAGLDATSAYQSNFFGFNAGDSATNANDSNFLGISAGESATDAFYSNFLGQNAGLNSTKADNSNFLGYRAGRDAINANNSNFFGQNAGRSAASASNSILIGQSAGYNVAGGALGIKSNNIIIGTNITLPNGAQDSINLGAIIFATGSYSASAGNPFSGSVTTGRVGINQLNPTFSLDVSGSGRYTNGLQVTGSLIAPIITGSLFGSSSYALTASYALNGGGGSGLTTKANAIANSSFTGNPKKATITFSTAFPNTSYAITVTGEDARSWTIESKVAGSFVINANSNTALSGTTYWHAIAYGEA